MPLSPDSSNPLTGVMQSIMLRYHADMEAQVEHTLADLAGRWQGVRASLLTSITRLERQMQAAVKAGDTITYTWLAQQARLLDLKAAVAGDIAAYATGARDIIGQAQGDAAELGLAAAQAKLDALTPPGVNYTWGVPPRDVLDQIAGATQPYSPLYSLFEQMGAQAATNASAALFQSVALGEGPRAAAQRLVWATDMSARRAEVIARTEIHRAWRQAQFANYQANSDVVSSWMWSADFASERTCGACIALDGSIHPLDEELADHVCGRCDAIPVTRPWSDILAGTGIPDDELAALDEGDASTWMDYRESGGEWLARQPIDTQNRVLGPAKAEAWRQGAISLRDVAGITHDPTWGRSIEERSLKSLGIDAQRWLAEARSNGTAATAMSEEARSALSEWEQQRAAAIAEVKAAEAEAASAAAQPSEWEARRAAAIAEAEGFGAPASATQALEGVGAPAETSPVWQDIADKLNGEELAPFGSVDDILARQQALEDLYNVPMGDPTTMERENPDAAKLGVAEMDKMLGNLAAELKDNGAFMRLAREFGYSKDDWQAWQVVYPEWTQAQAQAQSLKGAIYSMLEKYHSAPASVGDITVWNGDPFQVAVLDMARKEFGLSGAHDYYTAEQLAEAMDEYGPYRNGIRALLRQMHNDTQQWFADNGITEVQVFRGVRWNAGDQPAGVTWNGGMTQNPITGQPLASWATNAQIAYDYATGTGMNFFADEPADYSMLLVARVPIDQVLSIGYTGLGSTPLRETMVMSGDYPVYAIPFTADNAPDLSAIYQIMSGKEQ